jgi:diacylglycerol kinase family enzyme
VRAVHAAREAHGCVVAAGGDGTLNAVAQVVWNADQLMGVLPQGTFNYFGRTHGMPADLDDSVAALLTAREQPITVGLLGERVFLVNASVGLYPRLLEDREAAKRRFGRHRVVALLSGLGTLLRGRSVLTLELSFEGQTRVIRTRTLFVGNNPLQLAALGLRHATDVEQGRLAAITLQPLSGPRTLWLLLRGALGRLDGAEGVDSFAFDELVVRLRKGARSAKVAMDGEVLRMPPPLVFRTAPRPLRLLVPSAAPVHGDGSA